MKSTDISDCYSQKDDLVSNIFLDFASAVLAVKSRLEDLVTIIVEQVGLVDNVDDGMLAMSSACCCT